MALPPNLFPPQHPQKIICFFMTSHFDSHTTTAIKSKMFWGVQTGNRIQHDEYHIRGTVHCPYIQKYTGHNIFMGGGARDYRKLHWTLESFAAYARYCLLNSYKLPNIKITRDCQYTKLEKFSRVEKMFKTSWGWAGQNIY